jgi:RNA polymerase sigma factor for flagellar operon FliA
MSCKERRIMEFLPWAQHFARSCAAKLPNYLDRDDLQSAGVLGFLRAASRYDGEKGASFRGYCAMRIRGAVLDELRKWDWAPRSVHKNHRRITRITAVLTEQLEREPTPEELAGALEIEMSELSAFQTMALRRRLISLDEASDHLRGEDGLPLTDRLADLAMPLPNARMLSAEGRTELLRCLKKLPKSQVTIIVLHYLKDIPLREIAAMLAVTPSRVSQLHHQALGRLRLLLERTRAAA